MNMQSPVEQIKRAIVVARPGKRDLIIPEVSLNFMRIVVSLVTGKIEWSFGYLNRLFIYSFGTEILTLGIGLLI